ncbi:uncharacterized protein LOC116302259 [Actinia tenebrosa]|uniref:Uncharacterized protein LOC116302259 n=1 Tax=Actinia tenebrosa TaxID=6105 RepID=A0A6P8ILS0_ACTTE|nr:uncharacterized protein LOC116302259 [Actinia tenebrosa]
MLGDARPSTEDDSDNFVTSVYLIMKSYILQKSEKSLLYSMESILIVLVSALLFRNSDAGSFTWLQWDNTVNVVEGDTAKLNWSVRISAGKTWVAVNITRNIRDTTGPGDVDMIRRKPSGVEILLPERGADMDLDVQANLNVLNITFSLRNISRKTDEMYYRITVFDDDRDSSLRYTKLNVNVPSSCDIHPNTTTVNETDKVLFNVTTTGNPPVYEYIWTHPNGSRLTANSRLTFTASRQDTGTYKISVYNGVGNRSVCSSNVTVQCELMHLLSMVVRLYHLGI